MARAPSIRGAKGAGVTTKLRAIVAPLPDGMRAERENASFLAAWGNLAAAAARGRPGERLGILERIRGPGMTSLGLGADASVAARRCRVLRKAGDSEVAANGRRVFLQHPSQLQGRPRQGGRCHKGPRRLTRWPCAGVDGRSARARLLALSLPRPSFGGLLASLSSSSATPIRPSWLCDPAPRTCAPACLLEKSRSGTAADPAASSRWPPEIPIAQLPAYTLASCPPERDDRRVAPPLSSRWCEGHRDGAVPLLHNLCVHSPSLIRSHVVLSR